MQDKLKNVISTLNDTKIKDFIPKYFIFLFLEINNKKFT